MRTAIITISLAGVVAVAGCDQSADSAEASNEPASHDHGATGAEPGSYEDWCGEHGVPESMCTRCNPALIPAFQATGDWCGEHGLPESQCLLCNPDLEITRPARAARDRP